MIVTIGSIIALIIIAEACKFPVYGLFVKDDVLNDILYNTQPINSTNSTLRTTNMVHGDFVAKLPFPFIFTYYVGSISLDSENHNNRKNTRQLGVIPRWSKHHKQINKLFEERENR